MPESQRHWVDLLLHSVFHNHSLIPNRSFSVKSTAEIFVSGNSSTLYNSELCGLLLEGKNGFNNLDKVVAGAFRWFLVLHEESILQSLYDSETNTKVSQVWKHKPKSQVMALLSVLCLLHSWLSVMENDWSWKGTSRYCRLAACWVQQGAGSKCFIQPNPVGMCWSSSIVLLTQEDVITAKYEGVNTLWNTVLAVMQTKIVVLEVQYQQRWLTG